MFKNQPTRSIAGLSVLVLLPCLLATGCGGSSAPDTPEAEDEGTGIVHEPHAAGETCFICDESLRDPGRLWCREHDRYEDRCWLCHPELEDKGRLYCGEHGLYEDECSFCRATEDDDRQSSRSLDSTEEPELFCREHRVAELACGICQPQLAGSLAPGEELKVRFESPESATKAGIGTVPARSIPASANTRAICEVSYNENALAGITPLASGIVRDVRVDVGADVEAGDPLVELHSAEVAEAKASFVTAVVDLELKDVACKREQRLADKKISSEKELQEAEAACKTAELAVNTARQRLLNLGFTEAEVESIQKERDTSASVLVRAPFSGTLVRREAVVGEAVQPGSTLFTLADLGTMWLLLAVPADQQALVRAGMPVEVSFGSGPPSRSGGAITWVDTSIDRRSRMLRARAVIDNTDRWLRAGAFGEARILLSPEEEAVGVPMSALQLYEDQPYVFVQLEEDLFSLRRIEVLDGTAENLVAVVAGLQPDEPVVAEGSFTVMSEFLKSRLGAGCVDD